MCSVNLSNFMCIGKVSNNSGFRQLMICYVSEFKLHITILWMQNKGFIHLSVLVIQSAFVMLHTLFIARAWWGSNLPRLPKLCICSLNLAGNSAFDPIHPLPSGWFLPQYWESSFCLAQRPHWPHSLQFGVPVLIQMQGWHEDCTTDGLHVCV